MKSAGFPDSETRPLRDNVSPREKPPSYEESVRDNLRAHSSSVNPPVHVVVSYAENEEWSPDSVCFPRTRQKFYIVTIIVLVIGALLGCGAFAYIKNAPVDANLTVTTSLTTITTSTRKYATTEMLVNSHVDMSHEQLIKNYIDQGYEEYIKKEPDSTTLANYFREQWGEFVTKPITDFLSDFNNIPLYIEIVKKRLNLQEEFIREIVGKKLIQHRDNYAELSERKINYNHPPPLEFDIHYINDDNVIIKGTALVFSKMLGLISKTAKKLSIISSSIQIDANFTGQQLAIISPNWEISPNIIFNLSGDNSHIDGGNFLGIGNYNKTALKILTDGGYLISQEVPWQRGSKPQTEKETKCQILQESIPSNPILKYYKFFHSMACTQVEGTPGFSRQFINKTYTETFGNLPNVDAKTRTNQGQFESCYYYGFYIQPKALTVKIQATSLVICENKVLEKPPKRQPLLLSDPPIFQRALDVFTNEGRSKRDPKMFRLLKDFESNIDQVKVHDLQLEIDEIPNDNEVLASFLQKLEVYQQRKPSASASELSDIIYAKGIIQLKMLQNKLDISLVEVSTMQKYLETVLQKLQNFDRTLFLSNVVKDQDKQWKRNLEKKFSSHLKKFENETNVYKGIINILNILTASNEKEALFQFESNRHQNYMKIYETPYGEKRLPYYKSVNSTSGRSACKKETDFCKKLLCAEILLEDQFCDLLNLTGSQAFSYWFEYRKMYHDIETIIETNETTKEQKTLNVLKQIKVFNQTLALIVEDLIIEYDEEVLSKQLSEMVQSEERVIREVLRLSYTKAQSRFSSEFDLALMHYYYKKAYYAFLQWMLPCSYRPPLLTTNASKAILIAEIKKFQDQIDVAKVDHRSNIIKNIGVKYFPDTKSGPFYVWANSEITEELLKLFKGEAVDLRARLLNPTTSIVQGIKFQQVNFRFSNPELQRELRNFEIEIFHSGLSHFYYKGQIIVTRTTKIKIVSHLLYRDDNEVPNTEQFLVTEPHFMQKGTKVNTNLSPYTMWQIRLVPKSNATNFSLLIDYANQTDILLIGKGWYGIT